MGASPWLACPRHKSRVQRSKTVRQALLDADVRKRPHNGACRSRGQQGAIRQPQATFEVDRRLPDAKYLATGNDARHRRGLKIAHRYLEGRHHQGEALRDAAVTPMASSSMAHMKPPCTAPDRKSVV